MAALASLDVPEGAVEDPAADTFLRASIDPVLRALDEQGMPWNEIDAVLNAQDPQLVHHYLELHGERLEERLAQQMARLADIERLLVARSASGLGYRASA